MSSFQPSRRRFIRTASSAGMGLLLSAATVNVLLAAGEEEEKEVGATEDLMREHGVLRRALLVYRQTAPRLRKNPADIDSKALHQAAMLFRHFGEDYHEKKLEEAYIFPAIRKAGGEAASYPDILEKQHNRGREITDYILSVTRKGHISANDTEDLAHAFESMDRMYENHTAREDTIVFPAWKDALSANQFKEMGEKFEEIEHQQFGKDGFEDAVKQISSIEQALGYANLAQFTAPPLAT